MQLTPVIERYVLHWGEMGTRWGVNRSVAQIHALLYLAGRPLTAEEIAETLVLARSNVSTSLKELQGWRLVQLTHVMGDRRDHFEAKRDTWDMLMTIVEERKQREIDPTLEMLRQCIAEGETDRATPDDVKARIATMLQFIETLSRWYDDVRRIPRPTLTKLMNLGARIARFVGG
jgi:DNA-binding transcriptional regulator GbsR (MarR family)